MPDNIQQTPIQMAWINYVKSVQRLLVPQADNRPLDQYLPFRDAVLILVQNEQFLTELDKSWGLPTNFPGIREAFLLELQAFPRAVEVAQVTEKPEEPKKWWRNMLGQASTVSGSVNDLLQNLPPAAKSAITLFKELIDLFKEKD